MRRCLDQNNNESEMAMKFSFPNANDDDHAEIMLAVTAKFNHREVPPPHERIRKLTYEHNGETYVAEVGKPIHDYYRAAGAVLAIFAVNPLLICLLDRGVRRGEPIYVNARAVIDSEFFELEP